MIEAIAFDWDGVISDSANLQVYAEKLVARDVAQTYGYEIDIDAVDWDRFKGWGRVKIASELFGIDANGLTADEYRQNVVDATVGIIDDRILQPIEGAVEFLQYVRKRVGKLAVVTSSNRAILDRSIALFGMQDMFDDTIAHREAARDKPYPDQYLKLMSRINTYGKSMLIVEDSNTGIKAGTASGGLVLAVATTCSVAELQKSKADLIACDFSHAVEVVQPHFGKRSS